MLELDNELFQTVVLGLLLLSLLILLLALNNLSKIKKTFEEALTRSQIGDITSSSAGADTASAQSSLPAHDTHAAAGASPESRTWTPEAAAAPAATSGWSESAWAGPSETIAERSPQAAPVPQAAVPAHAGPNPADMPDEQPVEHEGRWWFKRGGEILLYDEATGQWGPAPQDAAPQAAAPASSLGSNPGGGSAYSDFQDLASSAPQPEPAAGGSFGTEGSGFWKCVSCGAVNGSTATSCRMCFTARA